jgi:hypothetical protein
VKGHFTFVNSLEETLLNHQSTSILSGGQLLPATRDAGGRRVILFSWNREPAKMRTGKGAPQTARIVNFSSGEQTGGIIEALTTSSKDREKD